MSEASGHVSALRHGAVHLPAIVVDIYNADLRDAEGFVGDRASRRAFTALIEDWRERLRKSGQDDPLGDIPAEEFRKRKLDKVLLEGEPEAAALVHSAVEDFAQELAAVIRRFLRLKEWRETQTILIGGGFRASRLGELAIGRADLLLKPEGHDITLQPIRYHPDEAGLIGCVQLAPSWIFSGHDSILAVDIGGTNFRAGLVELKLKKAKNLSGAQVRASDLWRHADDQPVGTKQWDAWLTCFGRLSNAPQRRGSHSPRLSGSAAPDSFGMTARLSGADRTCRGIGRLRSSTYLTASAS